MSSALHDWRLVPVALASWAGAWFGTTGWTLEPGVILAMAVGALLIILAALRLRWILAAVAVAVLAITVAVSGVVSWQRHSSPVAEFAADRAVATVQVRVAAEPIIRPTAVIARAELLGLQARGRQFSARQPVLIVAAGDGGGALRSAVPGAVYSAKVRLAAPEPDDSVSAILRLRALGDQIEAPGLFDRSANAMRQGLRDAVAHSPPRQAALVPSLVVGDTSKIDPVMEREFQTTGLTHLLAVSGANLALTLSALLAAVRAVGLRGWAVRAVAVAGVGGFILVCGQEPSVLRAAAMGLVTLAATGVGTGRRSVRALSLAVIALMWLDPWLSRSVGFVLSVAACAGIVLLGPRFVEAMTVWAPRWAAEALAVPLSAQIATQPVVTAISDQVSVVGIVANVLAGPFVGPTTVLGLAAALLCWVPFLAAGPGWVAGWCAQPIIWLAQAGAGLPSAAWEWESSPTGIALVTLACAALGIVCLSVLRRRWAALGLIVCMVGATAVRPVAAGWPGEWSVTFCDVGQGDATVINAGSRSAIVVDAGPESSPTVACLAALGVSRVPLLVLTHYHADHTGGADDIIARFEPALILVRAGPKPAWLERAADETGAELRSAQPGERITVGDAAWTTVSVWEPAGAVVPEAEGEGSAENDASVVGLIERNGLRVLLPGDLEPDGQRAALRTAEALGLSLEAHVFKLPHHGSARQEKRFAQATSASVAIASSGKDNSYGHPAASALALADSLGMRVFRTDQHGAVAVSLDGSELVVNQTRRP